VEVLTPANADRADLWRQDSGALVKLIAALAPPAFDDKHPNVQRNLVYLSFFGQTAWAFKPAMSPIMKFYWLTIELSFMGH
jgi:hypothetical protein